eukprot:scaffold8341_cov57-Attheya_sp.AAC.3
MCWRDVGRMTWLSSPRNFIPVVPYLMDLAMGVVNDVVVVVLLGSNVPTSPPFECDCRVRAAAWGGSVVEAIIFWRHVSAHSLIR